MSARKFDCWIVCGATWPFQPSLWRTKREAMRDAAAMRRHIRANYGPQKRLPKGCGIVVEGRRGRDMASAYRVSGPLHPCGRFYRVSERVSHADETTRAATGPDTAPDSHARSISSQ